ncbi:MAG: hypothetical protein ACOVO9_02865 [Bacteroidia bacterium]
MKKQNKFEESIKAKMSELETKPSDSLWAKLEKELDTDSFEPTLRAKFEDFSLPVSEQTWTNIEAQLPQEKNKKRILAFWFTGIFLSALSLGFLASRFYFPGNSTENSIAIVNEPKKIENQLPLTNQQITNEVESSTQEESSNQQKIKNSSLSNEETKQNSVSENIATENSRSENLTTENALSENSIAKKSETVSSDAKSSTKKSKAKNSSNKTILNATAAAGSISLGAKSSKAKNQSADLGSNSNTTSAVIPPVDLNTKQSVNTPQLVQTIEKQNPVKQEVRELQDVSAKIKLEDVQIKFDKDSIVRTQEVITENYESEDDKPGKFSISAIVGVYRTEMILSKPSSSIYDLNKVYDLRTKLEKPSVDWSGGFLLNYHASSHLMISSGVQISNFRQSLHYDLAEPKADTFGQIQSQNLYLHPTDSIIEGHVKTAVNKYSFTEIPIWITYSILTDKKVGFDFMLGYSFAFLTSVNAYMPDPAMVGLLTVNDKTSFPFLKGSSFINIAPAVTYRINNTVQLGLMPQFKLGLSSVIDNKNWIQEKPMAIGLNFYLRKRF